MNLSICKSALFAQLGYVPHKGQLLVHRSKAKRRVLCTGSRWGSYSFSIPNNVALIGTHLRTQARVLRMPVANTQVLDAIIGE